MTRLSLETVVKLFVGVLAAIIFLSIIWGVAKGTTSPIISFFDKLIFGEKAEIVGVSGETPFYNEFVKEYQECKLSPDTNCYCKITYASIPEDYILELQNNPDSKTTLILLHDNANLEDCKSLATTHDTENFKTISTAVKDDLLYFKNYISFAGFGGPKVIYPKPIEELTPEDMGKDKLSLESFTPIDKLFLHKKELCTPKDVLGSNNLAVDQGAYIYKFDQEKTTIINDKFGTQKTCSQIKDSNLAYEEFNRLTSAINGCKDSVCTYSIMDGKFNSVIPKDFKLLIENKKIVLKYKDQEIKFSDEIKKELCVFTHFKPALRQEKPLDKLELNNYLQLDIYQSENKLCFLPYTKELVQQKISEELKIKTQAKKIIEA